MTPHDVARAAAILAGATRLLVSTGAGMSRESGIPTFRDAQEGLWARFAAEELATEAGFRANPARVWGWYAYRRARIDACAPHAGHRALVELERLVPELVVVTQNIDGLHQRAGAREVIELHGSIHRTRCVECARPADTPTAHPTVEEAEIEPPRCVHCGGHLRPGVVWFGEPLPRAAAERAWALAEQCDALLLVGTSGLVWPAAELPLLARRRGAPVVEVNPRPSELTPVADVFLDGPAGEVLPALVRALDPGPER